MHKVDFFFPQNPCAFTRSYLRGEQSHGTDAHPAVDGVEGGDVFGAVDLKHGTQAHDGQEQSQQHEACVGQLPGPLVAAPGERDPVQHCPCSTEAVAEGRNQSLSLLSHLTVLETLSLSFVHFFQLQIFGDTLTITVND